VKIFDAEFLQRLEALRLAVRRAVRGRREGDRATRRRGGAAEFLSHRTYTTGDEFRAIDWHVYARLGQLFVRERSREELLTLHLVLDASPSMEVGEPSKAGLAREVAAGLAAAAFAENARVVLWEEAGGRSLATLGAALEALPSAGAPPAAALRRLRADARERGIVALLSDLWDDGLREALLGASAAGDVAAIHILSPRERKPEARGRLRLADSESGETVDRFVGDEEAAEYGRLLAEHCESWKRWCGEHEFTYVRCGSETPWHEVVGVALREAGVLE
jgi:uncharacterized protein (DUF58 family)